MKVESVQRYRTMMIEIKGRTRLVKEFGEGAIAFLPAPARVEIVYLNLRKILELIAMGSLVANVDAFSKMRADIQNYWHAKELLKDIQAINPDFYPLPIVQKPSERPGIKMDWLNRRSDYLTKDRFVTLYNQCGSILHARNPFAPQPKFAKLEKMAPKWYLWIVNLLNTHLIRLTGDPNRYLIQMGAEGQNPTYTPFGPAPREKDAPI